MAATWDDLLRQARQETGYRGPSVSRNLRGVRAALRPVRLEELDGELSRLSDGAAFDAFLDHWWTQALADSAPDAESKEAAIDFADLAIALRVRSAGIPGGLSQAQVEAMLKDVGS